MSVISKEEKVLILGQDLSNRMDTLKEVLIKQYGDSKYYKDIESDEEKRLASVEKEFKWDMTSINKLIFEKNPMTQQFINSDEFKKLAKNLLVVMFDDIKVEKKYDVMIKRLQYILGQNLATPGVISQEHDITIDQLANDKYFNNENKLINTNENLSRSNDQALKNMLPIEAKIDQSIGISGAGRKLVGKFGEGFTKPGEMQVALLKALCYFKDIGEMKSFLGIEEGNSMDDTHIAQAAFNTYEEALENFSEGKLAENEFNEVLELIRIVASILMLTNSNPGVAGLINAQDRNYDTIHKVINDFSVGVKAHVFVNVFQNAASDNTLFKGIDINKLKTELEKKDNKGSRILSGNIEELSKMMKEKRLKVDALTSIRNSARAVAAAA
jgi:hypothetical protein